MEKKLDKVLVRLTVPAVNRTFDVFVPLDLNIAELTKVFVRGVEYLCDGSYVSSKKEKLNLKSADVLLNPALTLFHYGLKDGTEIIMI